MTPLPRLVHARELLDEPVHDPAELEDSLDDVAAVNRWLGGTRALLRHLAPLLPAGRRTEILDAGTGSGDLPRAIVRWARRHGRDLRITATDIHPQTLEIARRRSTGFPEITFERADVLALPYPDRSFDIALLSLTLHHMEGAAAVTALRELGRVARRAVLVGELLRSRPAYLGARILAATVWRGNRLTRHDGPISVLRAFTPDELLDLARRAGLPNPRVHRHPLFRLVLVAAVDADTL
ncbi:MAG TPA: methyltransferase domain-containing protein [Longimicrobiales bacterium]